METVQFPKIVLSPSPKTGPRSSRLTKALLDCYCLPAHGDLDGAAGKVVRGREKLS